MIEVTVDEYNLLKEISERLEKNYDRFDDADLYFEFGKSGFELVRAMELIRDFKSYENRKKSQS